MYEYLKNFRIEANETKPYVSFSAYFSTSSSDRYLTIAKKWNRRLFPRYHTCFRVFVIKNGRVYISFATAKIFNVYEIFNHFQLSNFYRLTN